MSFLPIYLNLEKSQILIVGGGRVALQKLQGLIQFTSAITVCAPRVLKSIKVLPVSVLEQAYSSDLLENASLVYACTNDPDINQQIRIDARLRHILVNVADNPVSGDFISPALCRHKELTVAVSSNGLDVNKAIYWRNRIKTLLEVEE